LGRHFLTTQLGAYINRTHGVMEPRTTNYGGGTPKRKREKHIPGGNKSGGKHQVPTPYDG